MNDVESMSAGVDGILKELSSLTIDVESMKGEVVDSEKVSWYTSRVTMLLEDGCPDAVNAYLNRMCRDDMNSATRLFCLKAIMELQEKYLCKHD